MIALGLVLLTGACSAVFYARARRWLDAVLVLLAAAALAGLVGGFKLPPHTAGTVAIDPDAAVIDIDDASAVSVEGDGLSAARWRDLPARPLHWRAPDTPALWLDFPRHLALGRQFRLTARVTHLTDWRLQLLAENGRLLAQSDGKGDAQALVWTPPAQETMVLQARLLNASGALLAQGPVPLEVVAPVPLRVRGRFASPSFDTRALHELLADSGALLDWQVTLAPGITRSESPREAMTAADLLLIDASWFEQAAEAERAALLAQVRQGAAMLVLGASARRPEWWDEQLAIPVAQQTRASGITQVQLWTRALGEGRVGWLGNSGWHRHAIARPRQLALWWQDIVDQLEVRRHVPVTWLEPAQLALPGQRTELCALSEAGATGPASFPQLGQTLNLRHRADRLDAACVAVWPAAPGWLTLHHEGVSHRVYVYAPGDWPWWQAGQRRDATLEYAARTPTAPIKKATPLPAWPFGLLFALAMLTLWWREPR